MFDHRHYGRFCAGKWRKVTALREPQNPRQAMVLESGAPFRLRQSASSRRRARRRSRSGDAGAKKPAAKDDGLLPFAIFS